jgi:hypothetical protein
MQTVAIAKATVRELLRRRSALLLLVAFPLAFYLARRDVTHSAIVVLALGLGWAAAMLALFSTINGLELDGRLRVAGYSTSAILFGRMLSLLVGGLILMTGYLVLAVVDQDVTRLSGVVLMLFCALVIGVPLGMTVGLVLKRELEGTLALLILLATQFMTNPERLLARLLPMWSVRGVADWAIDLKDRSFLIDGLTHAGWTLALLVLIITCFAAVRLRIHPYRELSHDVADSHS